MAGLFRPVPAIQVPAEGAHGVGDFVDARVKPAHDDFRLVSVRMQQSVTIPRAALHEGRSLGISVACPWIPAFAGRRFESSCDWIPPACVGETDLLYDQDVTHTLHS
jgi:hypothetical protein